MQKLNNVLILQFSRATTPSLSFGKDGVLENKARAKVNLYSNQTKNLCE
jgi:hypothetical protein